MNPTYDLSGQVAVVTGAGAGMGLDTARAFAAAGAAVVLADVNEQALRAAEDEMTAAGHRALGVTCDVANEDQVATSTVSHGETPHRRGFAPPGNRVRAVLALHVDQSATRTPAAPRRALRRASCSRMVCRNPAALSPCWATRG